MQATLPARWHDPRAGVRAPVDELPSARSTRETGTRDAMPRPIWSGAISFGLVNVPVKLFSAVSPKDVRFHELHRKDGVRLTRKRMCPAEDVEVAYEEVVKGYELSPGRY